MKNRSEPSNVHVSLVWEKPNKHQHQCKDRRCNQEHQHFLHKADANDLLCVLQLRHTLICFIDTLVLPRLDLLDNFFVAPELGLEVLRVLFHALGHADHLRFDLGSLLLYLLRCLIEVDMIEL